MSLDARLEELEREVAAASAKRPPSRSLASASTTSWPRQAASRAASWTDAYASASRSSGTTGLLMCGPVAYATPQCAIAHRRGNGVNCIVG